MTDPAEAPGDASRNRKFLAISAEDRVFLTICGHGDDIRFARIFGETWPKIPAPDRAQMVEHCKPHERVPGVLGLDIKMENLSTLRERRQLGVCDGSGTSLNFYAPAIDRLPPKHVAALIAHELAHVRQASRGTLRHTEERDPIPDAVLQEIANELGRDVAEMQAFFAHESDPLERDADRVTKRWGFNVPAMRRWARRELDWDDFPDPVF